MPTKSAHDSCDFSQAIELDAGNAGTYAVCGSYITSIFLVMVELTGHCGKNKNLSERRSQLLNGCSREKIKSK